MSQAIVQIKQNIGPMRKNIVDFTSLIKVSQGLINNSQQIGEPNWQLYNQQQQTEFHIFLICGIPCYKTSEK